MTFDVLTTLQCLKLVLTYLISVPLAHRLEDNYLCSPHTLEHIASVVCLNSRASAAEKRQDHLRGLGQGVGSEEEEINKRDSDRMS